MAGQMDNPFDGRGVADMAEAYCWRGGIIEIGVKTPRGALRLAAAPKATLKRALSPLARLAYDGTTLLVPGVPEAETDDAALEAVRAFVPRLQHGIQRHSVAEGR